LNGNVHLTASAWRDGHCLDSSSWGRGCSCRDGVCGFEMQNQNQRWRYDLMEGN
jgi:hypothetical protein